MRPFFEPTAFEQRQAARLRVTQRAIGAGAGLFLLSAARPLAPPFTTYGFVALLFTAGWWIRRPLFAVGTLAEWETWDREDQPSPSARRWSSEGTAYMAWTIGGLLLASELLATFRR